MLMDKELTLSDAQAVTTDAASTNIIDLLALRDIGRGEPVEVHILVTQQVTASGAATVTFVLETDDNSSFSSAAALWTSAAIGKATLAPGYRIVVPVPPGVERYLRLTHTIGTGPLTAGKFTSYLTPRMHDDFAKIYPRAGYPVA